MRAIKDNRGVTLVELITSIAIFGIVAAAAISMIVFASKTNEDVMLNTQENMKIVSAFDLVKSQIRECDEISVTVTEVDDIKKLNGISFGDDKTYAFYEDKFVFRTVLNGQMSETVLFEGVGDVVVKEHTSTYVLLRFEFESGQIKELAVSCRN